MKFDKKYAFLFLLKFLGLFLVLYLFLPFYQGITGVGGKMYVRFLDEHVNLVQGFTLFLTGSAKILLQAFDLHVSQINYHVLRIEDSRGISVNPSCLGWGVMSFWIAFVFANEGTWRQKLKWMLLGVSSICLLNIARIALIAAANHFRWTVITSLDPHQVFNVLCYACIFILMYLYLKMQKNSKDRVVKNGQNDLNLSGLPKKVHA
jgi:exosortase/archaeosortase family protein